MSYNNVIIPVLDLTTLALEICVAVVLFWKRLYREVPWFTAYIGYLIAFTYLMHRVYVSGNKWAHFYGYWAGNAITLTLAFMVILEVCNKILLGYKSVRDLGIKVIATAACLTLLIALATSAYGSQWGNSSFPFIFMRFVQVAQRSVRIVQLGLLVGLFAFSSYFALTWKNYTFGIALGYGLYACVDLCSVVTSGFLGPKMLGLSFPITIINALAYMCTLLLWTTYLIRPDCRTGDKAAPAAIDLERWNQVLNDLVKK